MNKWVKEWINITITINTYIYKSTTRKTIMYLQAVNPHPTLISTLLWQFCSWPPCPPSPVFAVHHDPHCCCETRIWSWMRKRHWGCPCLSEQKRWGRPWWCPLSHTTLKQEQENMCGIIWLSLCLLSMSTNTCKTFKQSKTTKDY